MPELPEVETIVRTLHPRLIDKRILGFESFWPKKVLPDCRTLRQAVLGKNITALNRRAKYLVFGLEDGTRFVIHLGMTGRLFAGKRADVTHVRAWFDLDGGWRLWFCDARKFGRIQLLDSYADFDGNLGIEPLSQQFTAALLRQLLKRHSRALKLVLLDQSVIAGLGNIYTDEALFLAKLSPTMPANLISLSQAARLRTAIRRVLQEGIRCNGTSFDWVYQGGEMQMRLRVYQQQGKPCSRCGRSIEYFKMAGRGTHVCVDCQRCPTPKKECPLRKKSDRSARETP